MQNFLPRFRKVGRYRQGRLSQARSIETSIPSGPLQDHGLYPTFPFAMKKVFLVGPASMAAFDRSFQSFKSDLILLIFSVRRARLGTALQRRSPGLLRTAGPMSRISDSVRGPRLSVRRLLDIFLYEAEVQFRMAAPDGE